MNIDFEFRFQINVRSNQRQEKRADILVSRNQSVKAKDVVGNHWKMEAKLLGVSSLLRKVQPKFLPFSRILFHYL